MNEKTSGAKDVSLVSMIVGAVWIGILSLIRAFWPVIAPVSTQEFGLTVNEIIITGIVLAAIFTPVYLSIILDKINTIKIGSSE